MVLMNIGDVGNTQQIQQIPSDVWSNIGSQLSREDHKHLRAVCHFFHSHLFAKEYLKNHECADIIASRMIQSNLRLNKKFKINSIREKLTEELIKSVGFLFFSNLGNKEKIHKNFSKIISLFPGIQGLYLNKVCFSKDKKEIEALFKPLSTVLTEVQWVDSDLDDESIAYLSCLKKLKKLNISGNPKVTGSSLNTISNTLEELDCKGDGLRNDTMTDWTHFKNLEKLTVSGDN
jgi:hypothetical protein